jgi:hypothetical protein
VTDDGDISGPATPKNRKPRTGLHSAKRTREAMNHIVHAHSPFGRHGTKSPSLGLSRPGHQRAAVVVGRRVGPGAQ